jgi:hypothetical protein
MFMRGRSEEGELWLRKAAASDNTSVAAFAQQTLHDLQQ